MSIVLFSLLIYDGYNYDISSSFVPFSKKDTEKRKEFP